ncbi:hypothetical protein CDAR_271081 [Caerostris darwini]|uniref:Uncharacterized protein n=1 Tax=Caerostris darwini TaxID=1538125 RepID=A0AAV4TE22_9ARAC|nr:hypothetical protein CDAR_271081 [Caerostris darwini]
MSQNFNIEDLLKHKRIVKDKITRLTTQVNNLQNQENSISVIEGHENDVNTLDSEVNKLINDILCSCLDKEFDKYEQEMHELFSKLDSLKITLKDELKKLIKNDNSSNAYQSEVNTVSSLKFPRVELPVLTSNYIDWISFRDSFLVSVGNNESLSDSQKLQYLELSVKDKQVLYCNQFKFQMRITKKRGVHSLSVMKTKQK